MKRKSLSTSQPEAAPAPSSNSDRTWKPLPDSLTRWTGFMLAWVAHVAEHEYASTLTEIGLRPQHLAILTLLDAEGPMVQARIGERLGLVKHAIVSLLNDLELYGLAQRRPHVTDRRAFTVHVTDAGHQRIQAAEAASEAATRVFFADLSPEEQATFHDLLTRLASSNARRLAASEERNDSADLTDNR